MFKKGSFRTQLKEYSVITLGLLINALGWTAFLIPAKIVGGGISGVAASIFYATEIPVAYSFFAINAILIGIGIKVLGKNFGIKTIYSVVVLTFFFGLLQKYITAPIITEGFMSTIIGGALAGIGVGMVFTQGGSTGGTDIIAMIINKYRNISPGRTILLCDVFIISSSWFIFHSLEFLVYGFVSMAVVAYSIDIILSGAKQSVQLMIFTKDPDIIADRISIEVRRGVTFLHGRGYFKKDDSKIVLVVARKHETQHIIRIVKEVDPAGFISMGHVMGVFGKGFDTMRP